MEKKLLIINGVNLNLTGKRETDIYGKKTLEEIEHSLIAFGVSNGISVECVQSNIEGEIVNYIQRAQGCYFGIVLNAGAYSHYSYAIRDAIAAVSVPVIEVHMSNIFAREQFRKTSVISDVCIGQITGLGEKSYKLAIQYFI